MSKISKSRLLATSAVAGLSILQFAPAVQAQDSFGIHNDQPETLEITVAEDEEVVGGDIGIYADNGAVIVDNQGEIRGNGTMAGGPDSRPSGGVVIAQPGSSVTNGGFISGGSNGIATSLFFSEDEEGENLPPQPLAADTVVVNSGTIVGEGGVGVALSGGGSVTNDGGVIRGLNNSLTGTAGIGVAITEFAGAIDPDATGVGSIVNDDGGLIEGQTFGVVLQGGGTIANDGLIRSTGGFNPATGVTPFGIVMGASEAQQGRSATLDNDGVVLGFLGVLAGGSLETTTINNDGIINGNAIGIIGQSTGDLVINNSEGAEIASGGNAIAANSSKLTVNNAGTIRGQSQNGINILTAGAVITNSGVINGQGADGIHAAGAADGTVIDNAEGGLITGAQSGVHVELGSVTLTNAGEIYGGGLYDGFDAPPDGGVTISGGASTITNSGTITGERFGITTASYFNPATGQLEGRATGTTIVNSGTIYGFSDDGVRLIGGGSVTNSGEIGGQIGAGADGVSMFAYPDQASEDYSALVTNEADGRIIGSRFGVVLSGGGDVANDGTILGAAGGVYIQGTALNTDPDEERSGLTANVVNTGTIQGIGDFGGSHENGFGVGFGSDMAAATLTNSGTITSDFSDAVSHNSFAELLVTNEDGGVIEGAISGIYGGGSGGLTVDNAGTIRGNGTTATFTQFDAGVSIGHADSIVTNSGTISGAAAGIATFAVFDEELGQNVIGATGTNIVNSGTITGESAAGVRLLGGGTVANSGAIKSLGGDGIQIVRGDVALDRFTAEVVNEEGGTITGTRYGIVAGGGGGSVANAGTIAGFAGGVLIQSGDEGEVTTASVLNSGSISSVQGFGAALLGALAEASLENSGSIAGVNSVILNAASSTVVNAEGGTIAGTNIGIVSQGGALSLTNAGTITGTNSIGIFSAGPTTLVNSGTILGMTASPEGERAAFVLGAFDDSVTLQTGSVVGGAMVAGDGHDSLILDGDILELTEAQQVGAAVGFEELTVAAGYWSTSGYVGEFDAVTIAEGGALQVNEIEYDEGLFSTPIFTPAIANDGLLVVNFDESDVVSGLGQLSVTGTGAVQLIGEGVFTLDTDSFAHLGGTTVSNGGLILTGTLLGDVTTEGDGFFQLGAGGTEGNFAGDLVNNGRFVFNRSDDYDFLGGFSGNGTLDKMGDSVLTFMGDYAFEGVTNILGGAVRIGGTIDPTTDFNLGEGGTLDITGKDQTIGGLAGEAGSNVQMGENNLTVAQAGNSAFGGTISGSGSFTKSGDGTLNLTGDSDYTGPTAVNGGKLAVNGSIVSNVTVNDGGTLGGNGTVGSTTVAAGGTIAPGNSIGRLTVNGDLTFAAGSTYEVEVNAAGQGDRLDATGAVTIASTASVAVLAEEGDYNPRTDYVILTGAAGVTGTFGSVTTDLAFLDPLLRYGANSVTLSLYRNDIDFAEVALGFNQASVAGAVQSLGIDNPLFEAVLVQNAATARTSFGDLSGEIHANAVSGLTDDSRHLRNALFGMRAPVESGAFVWGSAFGGWGKFDAQPGGLAMDTDHKGLVAGIGYGGNGFAAALSAGIGGSDFQAKGRNDSADVESKYLAAHATYGAPEGGFRGTIGVSYAWHDVDASRAVTVAPFAQTLASKYDASTLQIFGEVGYDLTMGKALVTPFARLAHVKTDSEAFTEAGGNAALVVADIDQKTTFLSLGARARLNAGEAGFQPYLSAAWNRAFDDRGAIMISRFAAGGTPFGIIGSPIPKNSAEVEAGFDYSAGAFNIGAAYTGTLASDRNSHGVRVTARIAF